LSRDASEKSAGVQTYLTRWTQAGKTLQSNFFMPLFLERGWCGDGQQTGSVTRRGSRKRHARVDGKDLASAFPVATRDAVRSPRPYLRIVNADLGIRDTAAVPAFRVRLVLNDAVALGGTARHGDGRTRSSVRC
jgi:hypothetical protein